MGGNSKLQQAISRETKQEAERAKKIQKAQWIGRSLRVVGAPESYPDSHPLESPVPCTHCKGKRRSQFEAHSYSEMLIHSTAMHVNLVDPLTMILYVCSKCGEAMKTLTNKIEHERYCCIIY